ncbi:MAG: 2-C-methyl-D-erythritol 4-phosphate cytidylyltransferase [Solirubrobacteraceae bacterium]
MTVALIVAAGRGERLGAGGPKAFVELAGRPLFQWSIDVLGAVEGIERIVLALPPGAEAPAGVVAVQGGSVRSASVRRALAAAGPGDPGQAVLVHDAARPLLDEELVRRVLGALTEDESADGAIAAVPVTDTIKRVGDAGVVIETLDRSELWAVQTPQVFRRAALERALAVTDEILAAATDDAWLLERAGGRVIVVRAGDENLKVTTARDLELAELLLARRRRDDP